jgi:hypothetical protein
MKFLSIIILLSSLCFAGQDVATVRFDNGDQLSGNIVSLNLQTLTWQSELLQNQAKFRVDQIKELELPSKLNAITQEEGHEAVLELSNGNSVKGMLVGLNDNEIYLNTWFGGKMAFSKSNVKSITISRANKTIYRGPTGLEDWKVIGSENSWVYSNNEFTANQVAGIAREFNFSDEFKIGYNTSWKSMLRSRVILFTSDLSSTTPQSGYEIIIQGNSIRLKRLTDNIPLSAASRNTTRITPNDIARIEICVSRRTKKIHIFIDDIFRSSFHDEKMEDINGKGLIFNSDTENEIKLSDILISEWDGHIEKTEDIEEGQEFEFDRFNRGVITPPTKTKELADGRMMLANGDTVEGEILGIEAEMIKIKTPFTEVKFPIHRIKNIPLKKLNPIPTARLNNGDVSAVFADGSKLVFRLDEVKDGKIIGYSENFGRAEFLQSAFKRIEFDLYPKYK